MNVENIAQKAAMKIRYIKIFQPSSSWSDAFHFDKLSKRGDGHIFGYVK